MTEDRFSRQLVDTLAKRAANVCSNPDCQAMTTGPSELETRAITIGEAAHIFGANPGSARFDPKMSSAERSDITNAIWLCRNCHKLVDTDEIRFPAPLLFEWRREHERATIARIGKPGEIARQRLLSRELQEFLGCSYFAQQIVIDKPDHWEYKLTAELLRQMLGPVLSRWRSLEKGLYAKPLTRITPDEIGDWISSRMEELNNFIAAISGLINSEWRAAIGPPGSPGSDREILRVCKLMGEACQQILDWEERIRFASVPNNFKEIQNTLEGIGGRTLEKLEVVPANIAKIFEKEKPTGVHKIEIDIDLPEGWAERADRAIRAAFLNL